MGKKLATKVQQQDLFNQQLSSHVNMKKQADMSLELVQIESQINSLVDLCKQLKTENQSLREAQNNLSHQRASLLNQNEQARKRVEAMINRLKSLEN